MAVSKDIIFMLGCPRSGTTFLNDLVRKEMDVGFAAELQMIPKYYRKLQRYGDLNSKDNFVRLVRDMLQEPYFAILENNYSKMMKREISISEERILGNAPEFSLAGAVYGILKSTADVLDKKYVGNKHLAMLLHLDWLEELFPNCRVIHVIRDGRDCALSLEKMRWGHTNAYAAARFWARHIINGNILKSKLPPHRYLETRYEDFLRNPDEEASRLWNFIHSQDEERRNPDSFSHITASVKSGNCFKWKEKMPEKDIAIFQAEAGEQLKEYGYEIVPVTGTGLNVFQKWYYALENQVHREYKVRFRKEM